MAALFGAVMKAAKMIPTREDYRRLELRVPSFLFDLSKKPSTRRAKQGENMTIEFEAEVRMFNPAIHRKNSSMSGPKLCATRRSLVGGQSLAILVRMIVGVGRHPRISHVNSSCGRRRPIRPAQAKSWVGWQPGFGFFLYKPLHICASVGARISFQPPL